MVVPSIQTIVYCLALAAVPCCAQMPAVSAPARPVWQMQESGTASGLRGIHSVDGQVAWASGTEGTVLRTLDGGAHWSRCATPDAEKDGATLDFRGVQAWDSDTAIVMASGPGEKSRLYKTTDGCKSWKLLLKNTDPEGFYDAFWLNAIYGEGMLLGDPVRHQFSVYTTEDGGVTWKRDSSRSLRLKGKSLAAFAASNSSIGKAPRSQGEMSGPGSFRHFSGFVTGGKDGAFLFEQWEGRSKTKRRFGQDHLPGLPLPDWNTRPIPLLSGSESSGAFSLGLGYTGSPCSDCGFGTYWHLVAVGGDYSKPEKSQGTAVNSFDGGWTWTASTLPPHGYRSAVQWSEILKLWITVGTNGSDLSRDDGKIWQPLDDGNWNALSLPFAVGPKGRIARLDSAALPVPK